MRLKVWRKMRLNAEMVVLIICLCVRHQTYEKRYPKQEKRSCSLEWAGGI